jgi:branched-chain amino acid transport system permease protein
MNRKDNKVPKIVKPVLVIAIALLLPQFAASGNAGNYYTTILCQTMIYIIVVFGLNFITGMTGQVNLGTAGIYALGAYTSALLTTKLPISPWIALLGSILMGYLIGKGLGYPSLRVKGVYLSLTTIAFGEIVKQCLNNMAGFTGGTQGVRKIPTLSVFGYSLDSRMSFYYLLVGFVVVFCAISWRIIHSKWGRAFIAVRDNIEAMESCGINVADIKIKTFTLASIYACVAGFLYAHFNGYINPVTFSTDLSVNFVVMLMVGGIGRLPGNIIGACVVTILPEMLRGLGSYWQFVYSLIILLCAVLLPGGVLSIIRKLQKVSLRWS